MSRVGRTARFFFPGTRPPLIPSRNTGPDTRAERLWDPIAAHCPLTAWQRAALFSHGLQRISARPRVAPHRTELPAYPPTPGPRSGGATGSLRQRTAQAASAGPPRDRPIPARPRAARGPRRPRDPPPIPAARGRRREAGCGPGSPDRRAPPLPRGLTLCRRRSRAARLKTSRGRTRRQS